MLLESLFYIAALHIDSHFRLSHNNGFKEKYDLFKMFGSAFHIWWESIHRK